MQAALRLRPDMEGAFELSIGNADKVRACCCGLC